MSEKPELDSSKCDGCGLCISACRSRAIQLDNDGVCFIADAPCDWCTECEVACPKGAITCPFEIVCEEDCPAQ